MRKLFYNNLYDLLDSFVEYRPFYPALPEFRSDIIEKDSEFEITTELPGFEKEEIQIELVGNLLSVKADSAKRKVSKSYQLDSALDSEGITAKYKNGILTITVNKSQKNKILIPIN